MNKKFEDVLFLIQTGLSAAQVVTTAANPLLAASLDGANRLIKIGMDAYESGRERGEWTEAEQAHFDTEVRPSVTRQAHWVKA